MLNFLFIVLGGAFGTLMRYLISGIDYKFSNGVFPSGTLIVNSTGSFVIGFLWCLSERFVFPPNIRLLVFIGILGGYTTFSSFSLETFNLIRNSEYKIALMNILLSNILSISAVFAGFFISKFLLNTFFVSEIVK
jgi:fluoride exporter